jgi:hypothetical protein
LGRAEGEVPGVGKFGEETDRSHRYLVSADEDNHGVLMGSRFFRSVSLILSIKCRAEIIRGNVPTGPVPPFARRAPPPESNR